MLYSDDLIQNEYELDFIVCTQEWMYERIKNQREPHGIMIIDGDTWNEYVRGNTGRALGGLDLWRDSLWEDMLTYLENTNTLTKLTFDSHTLDLTVEW